MQIILYKSKNIYSQLTHKAELEFCVLVLSAQAQLILTKLVIMGKVT